MDLEAHGYEYRRYYQYITGGVLNMSIPEQEFFIISVVGVLVVVAALISIDTNTGLVSDAIRWLINKCKRKPIKVMTLGFVDDPEIPELKKLADFINDRLLKLLNEGRDSEWRIEQPEEHNAVLDFLGKPDKFEKTDGVVTDNFVRCRICHDRVSDARCVKIAGNGKNKIKYKYSVSYCHYIEMHGLRPDFRVISDAIARAKLS